jgi:hypothetical protein
MNFEILILLVIAVFFLAVILAILHSKMYRYVCRKCNHAFRISAFHDFLMPHGVGIKGAWKYLRCPKCKKFSRARVIRAKKA